MIEYDWLAPVVPPDLTDFGYNVIGFEQMEFAEKPTDELYGSYVVLGGWKDGVFHRVFLGKYGPICAKKIDSNNRLFDFCDDFKQLVGRKNTLLPMKSIFEEWKNLVSKRNEIDGKKRKINGLTYEDDFTERFISFATSSIMFKMGVEQFSSENSSTDGGYTAN